jgi:replicative DNA helicase
MATSEILDSRPPAADDCELKLLAAALRYPADVEKLDLRSDEFYTPLHAAIWDCFAAIRERREPIDDVTLPREFKAAGIKTAPAAEAIEKGRVLLGLRQYVPYYADQVRTAFKRRTIIMAAQDLLVEAWDESRTVEDLLSSCEKRLAEVQTGRWSNEPIDLAVAVGKALEEVEEIVSHKRTMGTMTGIPSFDDLVGGFFRGELAILAARPGIGKTSLALQIGLHAAEHGRRVYFASLEMSHVELAMKMLCSKSKVSNQSVRNANIEREDSSRMIDAGCQLAPLTFKIHDWPSIRVYDIRRAARAMKADFIVVDYLQLVTPTEKTIKRYEQVAQLAKDLKSMARELDVPVLVLAQLNRELDKQGRDARPRLSHLRESGDIEQTADMVLLLSRPKGGYAKMEKDESTKKQVVKDKWDAELEVAKNRKGAQPVIRLNWHEETTEYSDKQGEKF